MTDEHRTPGADRSGRRRPGAARRRSDRSGRAHSHRDAERQLQRRRQLLRERAAIVEDGRRGERAQSRFTGRMLVLMLVLAVLAVSYASSMRAYLEQRGEIEDHEQRIARAQQAIDELRRERDRWDDPAFVAQYARENLGYVSPGETPWVVLDGGEPLTGSELPDPSSVEQPQEPAWFGDLWRSTKVAGNPPEAPAPAAPIHDDAGSGQ